MNKVSAHMWVRNFHGKFAIGLLLALSLTALTSMGQIASAQEISESHMQAAKKAISSTKSTVKLNEILPETARRLAEQMIGSRPDIANEIADIVNEAAIELAPRRGDLEKEVAKIYARIFSESELSEIAAFFATTAGDKFLTELPLVVREVERASRIWGTGIARDLAEKVDEKMKAAKLD